MICAFTSKRGGTGKTAMSMAVSNVLASATKLKVIVVDLNFHSDVKSLSKAGATKASIDNILGATKFTDLNVIEPILRGNIIQSGKLSIIPATSVIRETYLLKKIDSIISLLNLLDKRYDVVVVDMNVKIYEELMNSEFNMTVFNILTQDICLLGSYNGEIKSGDIDGYCVLNRYKKTVVPEYSDLKKLFPRIIIVNNDDNISNIMNKQVCGNFPKQEQTPSYQGITEICDIIAKRNGGNTKVGRHKTSFWKKLLGRR